MGAEVPAAARFLEELATFDLAGDKEVSQEGLSLADISYLFSSPLCLSYRQRRIQARFELARAATGAARHQLLAELCSAKDLPKTITDTVHRARTLWNMGLADSQRIGFALGSRENAAVAAEWSLDEPIGLVRRGRGVRHGCERALTRRALGSG